MLLSGGLDSAVLVAEEAARSLVQPIYISVGLAWEAAERRAVDDFLAHVPARTRVKPLVALRVEMTDVYSAAHWAVTGQAPAYHTPDEDVYLPGRNIVLFSKAAIFCAMSGITRIAIGTLDHNPFPDATPTFRERLADALSLGLDRRIDIAAPYARTSKADVIRRGTAIGAPLALTLSCMSPEYSGDGFPRHCGTCSKCRERHEAFLDAGISDPTSYADTRFVIK
ncbi:MAG: 7-cyano-7-deazaguanine synthase [Acidobacteriaceae bacterium]|nr:7-cyano-7-deazaguanine synthase [Acidobacteriaceae bacterium]